jgi:hypothetical protein
MPDQVAPAAHCIRTKSMKIEQRQSICGVPENICGKSAWLKKVGPRIGIWNVFSMKLQQGQIWKAGGDYLRIVDLERLAVKYKLIKDPRTREGTHHHVSKKEFCRLIKHATLIPPEELAAESAISL